ncbi:hypothetical protein I302_100437 [Kwoniella bestiolae CBS 10118]|uniref:Uncharacterized protein n=1 Tax=Kwoniella bestiolae CBS 10118 TaxID=1296100 RepID=A0A1B9G534_9TREE|nr:hypothetical protein I302_03813 [Kwoniella bestiolae CBS 10118]OCF26135.1 hypothetical protein I302_03813 [Kwoniella bestiolae CBS 10118]
MLVWNLKERMGVKATRYRESLNQIEVIVDISQPKHIIIASSPRDYPLYDAIYDGSQFLEKLKHKITLTFEVRVPPSIYQDSKTKPRKVWEVNLQSPDLQPFNLNRLSRLLWLFIPEDSSTDIRPVTLGTHSWTYFANNSAQLSDDSELVIVNSTDLLAHGKNETYPTTEECKCAAPAFFRARFRVHLTRAVNREKHKEDGSFNGMNVVDKVKERMINTRFPSMEEYQRSEAPA